MPRPAKIWKRSENGYYYATIRGRQEKLSPDYAEALEIFHKLKAQEKSAKGKRKKKKFQPGKLSTTLGVACDAFLDYCLRETAERTFQNRREYLQAFCDYVGKGKALPQNNSALSRH